MKKKRMQHFRWPIAKMNMTENVVINSVAKEQKQVIVVLREQFVLATTGQNGKFTLKHFMKTIFMIVFIGTLGQDRVPGNTGEACEIEVILRA